jgi:hypothetical protein
MSRREGAGHYAERQYPGQISVRVGYAWESRCDSPYG